MLFLQHQPAAAITPKLIPGAKSDLVTAFTSVSDMSPLRCGQEARELIDRTLPACGALLLQNLPLANQEKCAAFVEGMGYGHMSFEPPGTGRMKASFPSNCMLHS